MIIMDEKRKDQLLKLLRDPVFNIYTEDEVALSHYNQALTHSSYGRPNNERLEFIGDGALDFLIELELFHSFDERFDSLKKEFPKVSEESLLTDMLHDITNDMKLSEKVMKIKPFEEAIRCGGGLVPNESIRAGALEAFIGAMVIDQGLEKTHAVVSILFEDEIRNAKPIASWKNKLQECVQARNKTAKVQDIIKYRTCRVDGTPDHDTQHTSTVFVRDSGTDWVEWGTGQRRKGKDAEMAAARNAFEEHCK